MLGKNSADNIMKYFPYFSQKISFNKSCKLSPGDNLHEFVKDYFLGENKKKYH